MSTFLGVDIDRAHGVANQLTRWHQRLDELSAEVASAEMLAEVPTYSIFQLSEAGGELGHSATAVRSAAEQLASFTLTIESPFTLARAVASVKDFDGTDNDPELDRRLRALRELVKASANSDAEAHEILAALLDADHPGDLRLSDLSDVDEARTRVHDLLGDIEAGDMTGNGSYFEWAMAELRAAVGAHVGDAQLEAVLEALVDPETASVGVLELMAGVLTGYSLAAVALAHSAGIDYDIADGWLTLERVDELTALIHEQAALDATVTALVDERYELLTEIAGTDDAFVIATLAGLLAKGNSAAEALVALRQEVTDRVEQNQIELIADYRDLDEVAAAELFDQMRADSIELVGLGYDPEDVGVAVDAVHRLGLDLDKVREVVEAEGLGSLREGVALVRGADVYAMSPQTYRLFEDFQEHFGVFDTALGGGGNDQVSIREIQYVAANPGEFPADVHAVAIELLRAGDLRRRLDDAARRTADVIGEQAFGESAAPADFTISWNDVNAFIAKQNINYLLSPYAADIDTAGEGGEQDRLHSQVDVGGFLEAHRHELSTDEISALEQVLANGWYDETWWERHGDTVTMAAGISAGLLLAVTFPPGSAAIPALLSSSASQYAAVALVGAGAGGLVTVGANAVAGNDLFDDVGGGALNGALGAVGSYGLATFALPQNATSAAKAAQVLGATADAAWMGSVLVDDPVFDFVDPDDRASEILGGISTYLGAGSIVLSLPKSAPVFSEVTTQQADASFRAWTMAETEIDPAPATGFDAESGESSDHAFEALDETHLGVYEALQVEIEVPTLTIDQHLIDLAEADSGG